MPVIAIIPTTGQRRGMLKRAVDSVRTQGCAVDALMIVVDGPEVVGRQVAEAFSEAQVIWTRDRQGVSAARNLGAQRASEGHLAFMDDDDVWKRSYLARVFEDGARFDVALTAFEKHKPTEIAPEKIPPERLEPDRFLVANPGLRGSNLVITRAAFWSVGGFDERLPAFNDMDFGFRLSQAGPWRYRRVVEHLVEFHSHEGPRLSTPGCRANRVGLDRFWAIYRSRMSAEQQSAFKERALKIWGVVPREV